MFRQDNTWIPRRNSTANSAVDKSLFSTRAHPEKPAMSDQGFAMSIEEGVGGAIPSSGAPVTSTNRAQSAGASSNMFLSKYCTGEWLISILPGASKGVLTSDFRRRAGIALEEGPA